MLRTESTISIDNLTTVKLSGLVLHGEDDKDEKQEGDDEEDDDENGEGLRREMKRRMKGRMKKRMKKGKYSKPRNLAAKLSERCCAGGESPPRHLLPGKAASLRDSAVVGGAVSLA